MKTVCIYHSIDLDGWMSAAIVKHWWKSQYYDENNVYAIEENGSLLLKGKFSDNEQERLDFVGYNYGQPIPDLSGYDEVIMCDISFPKEEMLNIIRKIGNQKLIWIDHHISALKDILASNITEQIDKFGNTYHADTNSVIAGNRATNFAACELTWQYFFPNEPMPEIVRLLGRYDCFGHKQQWRQVVGYEGYYEISNQGNVRSIDRKVIEKNTNKIKELQGKDLSVANSKRGYRVVNLFKDNKGTIKNVHQLVAEAFIPNLDNKPCINHKDSNRLNNHVDNLEWCTYEENNLHSIEFGDRCQAVLQLDENDIFINRFESIREAEEKTGIQNSNITAVCKGKRDKAGGYKWEYAFNSPKKPQFVPQDEEIKVLEFQYGARQCISNYEEAHDYLKTDLIDGTLITSIIIRGRNIYQYLCTEAQQVYKNKFVLEFYEPIDLSKDDSLNYPLRKFVCINKERFNPINFGIDYHKDGYDGAACFHYDGVRKVWAFSLYNDNGKVDCSVIAKQFGGGGHRGAAGMQLNNEQMFNLINKL